MAKAFASQGDTAEKTISFTEVGDGLYAFTAEGDPNTGVIIGDDSVMIVEAQATPRLARKVIDCVRSVTDKPISHLVLTHYHAVRVLGASAYGAREIIMSDVARSMVAERGQEDWDSEFDRFPRLFQGHEEIPGLTWPTTTFSEAMTVYLGNRRVDIMHLGRAHTAGDAVVWVPDQEVMFTGGHRRIPLRLLLRGRAFWRLGRQTLDNIAAYRRGCRLHRGVVMRWWARRMVSESTCQYPRTFVREYLQAGAAKGGGAGWQSLKEAWDAVRAACDPKFSRLCHL